MEKKIEEILSPENWYREKTGRHPECNNIGRHIFTSEFCNEYSKYVHEEKLKLSIPSEQDKANYAHRYASIYCDPDTTEHNKAMHDHRKGMDKAIELLTKQ